MQTRNTAACLGEISVSLAPPLSPYRQVGWSNHAVSEYGVWFLMIMSPVGFWVSSSDFDSPTVAIVPQPAIRTMDSVMSNDKDLFICCSLSAHYNTTEKGVKPEVGAGVVCIVWCRWQVSHGPVSNGVASA